MLVLRSYVVAVVFCVITMLCWGSWANTQKLAGETWRFELFYWDYVFGVMVMALIFAFTIGSWGRKGRNFLADLRQAKLAHVGSALLGGVIFNAANILLVAAIAIAGMAVAFPVGIGLALVLGVLVNYMKQPKGNPKLLFTGVASITAAIILCALAYRLVPDQESGDVTKGLVLAVLPVAFAAQKTAAHAAGIGALVGAVIWALFYHQLNHLVLFTTFHTLGTGTTPHDFRRLVLRTQSLEELAEELIVFQPNCLDSDNQPLKQDYYNVAQNQDNP